VWPTRPELSGHILMKVRYSTRYTAPNLHTIYQQL